MPQIDYKADEWKYLLEIARAITARLDLSVVLDLVIRNAVEIIGGEAGLIALRRPDQSFGFAAHYGLDANLLPQFQPLLSEISSLSQETPRTLTIPHLNAKLAMIAAETGTALKYVIALPLATRDRLVGIIFVIRRPTAALFSPVDEQVLAGFADHAAIAIENARLYSETAQHARELDAVIDGSANGIILLDASERIRRINRTAQELTGWSDNAIDQPCANVVKLMNEHGERIALPNFSTTPSVIEGYMQTADSKRGAFVQLTFASLRDDSGNIESSVLNLADVTRLKEIEAMKSTFLAGISHDLKTPLALIRGYAETLQRGDVDWDRKTVTDSLTIIADEAEYLNQLVNALLDAAQLDAGRLPLQISTTRVDELATKIVEHFRIVSPRRSWSLEFPRNYPTIQADPQRVRQVLNNLVTNAAKYSPPDAPIQIGGWTEANRIGVFVRDAGPGIPLADQARIFDRFARGQSAETRRTAGAGLGLYLCKAIVQQHGGKIWMENLPERGAAFYFTLPIQFEGEL